MIATSASRSTLQLHGRLIVTGQIEAITGLRIGSSDKNIGIGDAAQVLRDPLTRRPYIPGSSLRGKLRSLAERSRWTTPFGPNRTRVGDAVQRIQNSHIHRCAKEAGAEQYHACPICPVFGVTSDMPYATPTRLIVRDLLLSDASATALDRARTELPYTEVKTEVAIDRITAASTPRDIERVPAGAVFDHLELSFAVYEARDVERFEVVAQAMALLEDDYLGGHGARGYGRIRFDRLTLTVRDYRQGSVKGTPKQYETTEDFVIQTPKDRPWALQSLGLSAPSGAR